MEEKDKSQLLDEADRLLKMSDRELLALSLGKNESWGDNYQMTINVKLMKALHSLNTNITRLRKSMNFSSAVIGVMTLVILILTAIIVWKGL
jgi:hypothetical protein